MFKFIKENKKQLIISTYIVLLIVGLFNIEPIVKGVLFAFDLLMPLFIGLAIAFVLNMPMRIIEKWLAKFIDPEKKKGVLRSLSILLTLIFTILVLFLIFSIILPRVIDSFKLVFNNLSTLIDNCISSLDGIMKQMGIDSKISDVEYVKALKHISWKEIFDGQFNNILGFANGVITNAMAFMNTFMDVFLGFCLSIYLLSGKEKLINQLQKTIMAFFPKKVYEELFHIGHEARLVFEKFVGGQLVNCAMIGGICYITYLILKFPLPELNAALVTVMSIIPVFGPMFAMIISFILIFAFDPWKALLFVVVFQVVTNIESNVIYPKVVGSSIGLPGLWVLLSIFILGDLFGIIGMILAVPVTALAYSLFRSLVIKRLAKKKIAINKKGAQ